MDHRPEPPSSTQSQSGKESQSGKLAQFLQRDHILPRARIPRRIKNRLPELPPEAQHRLHILIRVTRPVFGLIFLTVLLAFVFSALSRVSITEPKTAQEVLERVKDPEDVSFEVQTRRIKLVDGAVLRHDSIRGFQVDIGDRKIQAEVIGLRENSFRMVGDGKTLLYQEGEGSPGQIQGYPPIDQFRPVLGSDLLKHAGELVNNKATVAGKRGWLITWKPTPELILRLLSADLLAIAGPDIEAIRAGNFAVDYAIATIVRDSRRLYQVETNIRVNKASLEILATYRQQDTGQLDDLKLAPPAPGEEF